MDPREVAERLLHDESRTVSAFPDGSVDVRYEVGTGGERFEETDEFAAAIDADHTDVVSLDRIATEPGGHATNLAAQADRLGDDVTLAGHLGDPIFDDLPFETVSMGDPGRVSICEFDDGDVLFAENSAALGEWTIGDLDDALGDDVESFLIADAVCCTNWTSIESLPRELGRLTRFGADGSWFLVDPGSPGGRTESDVELLLDALEGLTDGYDVVLAGNPREIDWLADGIGAQHDDVAAGLQKLRAEAGLTAAVSHGTETAVVATERGITASENFDVEPSRGTGGGDRFDAGLVYGLVRDWEWSASVCLANACASQYVETGTTGTPTEIASFLRDRA